MPRERFKLIPAVYLILVRGDEVLLARRCGTLFGAGQYALVQGHVDGGETATAAVVREAREEIGIEIVEADLRCVHVMHRDSEIGEWFDLFFVCERWKNDPHIAEPDRCDDLVWRRVDDLPKNTMPYIQRVLGHWRRGEFFSTWGWNER